MRGRSPSDPAMVLIWLSILVLVAMLTGCKAFRGAATAVATTGSTTAAAGALLTPPPATDPKVIEDLIADRMDEFDTSFDRRQMVAAGLDPKCASWEALVQEGRIAPIMRNYFCRPRPSHNILIDSESSCPEARETEPESCQPCPICLPSPPIDLIGTILDAGGVCDGTKNGDVRCKVTIPADL